LTFLLDGNVSNIVLGRCQPAAGPTPWTRNYQINDSKYFTFQMGCQEQAHGSRHMQWKQLARGRKSPQ